MIGHLFDIHHGGHLGHLLFQRIVVARNVEAGDIIHDVQLLLPRAVRLYHLLVHALGAVPNGGIHAKVVGHGGDGIKPLTSIFSVRATGVDPHSRQRVAALALVRCLQVGVGDEGVDERRVVVGVMLPVGFRGEQ